MDTISHFCGFPKNNRKDQDPTDSRDDTPETPLELNLGPSTVSAFWTIDQSWFLSQVPKASRLGVCINSLVERNCSRWRRYLVRVLGDTRAGMVNRRLRNPNFLSMLSLDSDTKIRRIFLWLWFLASLAADDLVDDVFRNLTRFLGIVGGLMGWLVLGLDIFLGSSSINSRWLKIVFLLSRNLLVSNRTIEILFCSTNFGELFIRESLSPVDVDRRRRRLAQSRAAGDGAFRYLWGEELEGYRLPAILGTKSGVLLDIRRGTIGDSDAMADPVRYFSEWACRRFQLGLVVVDLQILGVKRALGVLGDLLDAVRVEGWVDLAMHSRRSPGGVGHGDITLSSLGDGELEIRVNIRRTADAGIVAAAGSIRGLGVYLPHVVDLDGGCAQVGSSGRLQNAVDGGTVLHNSVRPGWHDYRAP